MVVEPALKSIVVRIAPNGDDFSDIPYREFIVAKSAIPARPIGRCYRTGNGRR